MKKNNFIPLLLAGLELMTACTDSSSSFETSEVCPESGRGTFVDERDGQVYKYTTIGNQVWMAENLNYETDYSICYDNGDSDCNFWGRYYSLQENSNENGRLDYARVDSVCPMGWHVPTKEDFSYVVDMMGKYEDESTADRFKSETLWEGSEFTKNGVDEYGFSAIPSGYLWSSGELQSLHISANYWLATMKNSGKKSISSAYCWRCDCGRSFCRLYTYSLRKGLIAYAKNTYSFSFFVDSFFRVIT